MELVCRYFKNINNFRKLCDSFALYYTKDFAMLPADLQTKNKAGYSTIKVLCNSVPRILDWDIAFEGEFKNTPKYGWTFYAKSYYLKQPTNQKGLVKFLSSSQFKGVGKTLAERIVAHFGNDTLSIIENEPEKLLEVVGVKQKHIEKIKEGYYSNISFTRLCAFLSEFNISNVSCKKIDEYFGKQSLEIIKANPYAIEEIAGVGFLTSEKIAKRLGIALNSYMRIEGAVLYTIKKHCEITGDMYMPLELFQSETLKLLNEGFSKDVCSLEEFRKAVKKMHQENKISCIGKKCVYLKPYNYAETHSSECVARLLKSVVSYKNIDTIADEVNAKNPIRLSNRQMEAVKRSLHNRLSIITGGAGTGKTTILKTIIATWYKLDKNNKNVILLAPSGKAARRMTEAIKLPAYTIHSKLRLFEDYTRPIPLDKGLVIVDETSMVDNILFEKLMSSIDINSQVIFVGDVNQLPSVGSGDVLNQMIKSDVVPVSKLTEVFRQKDGGSIVDNATLINEGNTNLEFDENFMFVETKNEIDAQDKIMRIYESEIKTKGIDNVMLLTPLRRSLERFRCVSDILNDELQDIVNRSENFVSLNNTKFALGDRVLQWKNKEFASNGDIGVISSIEQDDDGLAITVDWDNGNTTVEDKEGMNSITLAYSISVHKSQGSEYDTVIIPVLDSQKAIPLFKRNLLYTAVTRGKKKVIIVGNKNAIDKCVNTTDLNCRRTLLALRLKEAFV